MPEENLPVDTLHLSSAQVSDLVWFTATEPENHGWTSDIFRPFLANARPTITFFIV